ncbi:MAG: glycine cleavage system protein GcvH [Syntrophomonadaceae bacterium]|jgi:glycine cleavage system H protein|nr:glycine cleavage system protein GcvH [Syntrophomonadaceae bacterium]MDD3271379.1 glycine cleavage system protein GcvH [Syntrophomonadaceae bacterium]MDD3898615.1 glycine cleavage system protein GcvH [Syntrophomonadaceae bacterium]MDD4562511.1 glycine cleavage system protein GcvH [Syntrophomonadaceae bacterium]
MNIPKDLLYTSEHEWIRVDGDQVYLGITDYAQHHLGDIVFVELPELDTEVVTGDSIAVVESVKAVSSVYSPVSGMVVENNEELDDSPELLNEDPYTNHIAVINISNPDELEDLMSPTAYEAFCAEQE